MRPTARVDFTEWEKEKESLFHELAALYLDVKVRTGQEVRDLMLRKGMKKQIEKTSRF